MGSERHKDEGTVPVAAVYDALASGLGEVVAGLRLLDRDLELGEDLVANLVGVDALGRLTLVLVVDGEGPELVLGVLDAFAFARRHAATIVRHLADGALRSDLDPRMLLIGERFDARSIERLKTLAGVGLDLFELQTLRSQGGEQAYLNAIHGGHQEPEVQGDSGELFVAALSPDLRRVAELALRRMRRVDSELKLVAGRTYVGWRLGAVDMAALHHQDGELFGSIDGGGAAIRLRTLADVEGLVERVLVRLVQSLEVEDEGESSTPSGVPDPLAVEQPLALLTSEELEAFRD